MTGVSRTVMLPEEGPQSEHPELAGRHVLLAEDNELNREIAVELLKMTGITVDYAENGKIALESSYYPVTAMI